MHNFTVFAYAMYLKLYICILYVYKHGSSIFLITTCKRNIYQVFF